MTKLDLKERLLFATTLEKLFGKSDKRQVCEKIGIRYEALVEWLNAKRCPSPQSLKKLEQYFGVDIKKFTYNNIRWYMTDGEIITNYKQAKNKKLQLGILADLNDVSVNIIKQKLTELGIKI